MKIIKKVFIPTDFSIKSLNAVTELIKETPNVVYDIVLIQGYQASNSISDLLFFSKQKIVDKVQSAAFTEAYEMIKNAHASNISSISVDIIPFKTKAYISTYFETCKIDAFVISENYKLKFKNSNSFDLTPYMLKSNYPIVQVTTQDKVIRELEQTEMIGELLVASSK